MLDFQGNLLNLFFIDYDNNCIIIQYTAMTYNYFDHIDHIDIHIFDNTSRIGIENPQCDTFKY